MTWTCDKNTQECGDNEGECKVVCDPEEDCSGNGECKKGKCDCYGNYAGNDCGKCEKSYHGKNCNKWKADVKVYVEYTYAEDASNKCAQLLADLGEEIEAVEDAAATSVTVTETHPSKKSKHDDTIEIIVTADLGDCGDRTVALLDIIAAIEDVDVSNLSRLSHSRD